VSAEPGPLPPLLPVPVPPLLPEPPAPPPEVVLRRLFLMLFLRGRGARGLRRKAAPKSIGEKLWLVLGMYAFFGCLALIFLRQPVFALGVYLHAMTFSFLGMYVASSAGEVLFNREENDILLHRPIAPRIMLWAKIRVLAEVSLWLAGAFNLAGFLVGIWAQGGTWRFPFVHAMSTTMEALFCTGSVVLAYQLCLTCFGRERLEGLITTAQVIVSIAAVLAGQVVPRVLFQAGTMMRIQATSAWTWALPPAWFAGFDDALAGSGARPSWWLAAGAVVATVAVLGTAFGLLARSYQHGMQALNETISHRTATRPRRRWLDKLVNHPPLSWCLRDSVSRTAFVLTGAYLFRDRDVKLRVYPGIAPMLVLPIIMMLQTRTVGALAKGGGGASSFMLAFGAGYLGLIPLLALGLLQYSQQWQASDLFRAAPLSGPAQLCRGARWAVLLFLTAPLLVLFGGVLYWFVGPSRLFLLVLPGILALPIFSLVAQLRGAGVPLSRATEEAKSTGRGLIMIAVMLLAGIGSALSAWAFSAGWFGWFLLAEAIAVLVVGLVLTRIIAASTWSPIE